MYKRFWGVAVALLVTIGVVSGPPVRAQSGVATAAPTTSGEAIVGFERGALPAVARGHRLHGLLVDRVSEKGSFLTVKAPSVGAAREAIAGRPGVAYVEDNGVMRALVTPNDAHFGNQYGPALMGFPTAWDDAGYGSSSVTVAVIDSGVLRTHEDLSGPRLLQGYDYVNNDSAPEDDCGHGTHVAGTVGASTNNAVGVTGMSQATLLPFKALYARVLGECSGSQAGIAQAIIDAADQGAKVISMSIGGSSSTTMQNAVNYAVDKGAILVAAAGNDGGANDVDYPAAYSNVIAVGAVTSTKARASYSDAGPQLDVAAPGTGVLSTYTGSDTAYASASGTSMATPHVAGAIALALGCAPAGTTRDAVISALYSTAEDLGAAGHDTVFGHGLARADRLVQQFCVAATPNRDPTAAFTASGSGALGVAVNGGASSDRDGDTLSYAWNFGDGATATGRTSAHTYAAAGDYTITLTVTDGRGGSGTAQTLFRAVADPDPGTKTIVSGQVITFVMSSSATTRHFKIAVPTGASKMHTTLQTLGCASTCPVDASLYTRFGARSTNTTYSCRSQTTGPNEACTTANPASGYWYVRGRWVKGSGKVRLTVTLS